MARAPKRADSVYDFLYVDARRIGVLLSQLGGGEDGVLTGQQRQTTTTSQTGGGLNAVVKLDHQESGGAGLTRTFDPQWLQPLRFLDLAEHMVVRDLAGATLGQIVLVKGSLQVLDFSTVKVAWTSPAIRKLIFSGFAGSMAAVTVGAAKHALAAAKKEAENNLSMAMELIVPMPHTVQATLASNGGDVWCTLREDGMIISSADIMLKYGSTLAGEWAVIGILDAQPEVEVEDAITASEPVVSLAGNIVKSIAPMARTMLGRPSGAYAVTPLLIMREVSGG